MKKMLFALAFLTTLTLTAEAHHPHRHHYGFTVQNFYDQLAPYGDWVYTPEYGYAWRPYIEYNDDFRPYVTKGHWVFTDLGWTWVSGYPWGWATFHYGRWFYDDYLGWMWVPGNEWAPAWVTWGQYNDCWAWAPMGPDFHINIHIDWRPPVFWWTFIPRQHFCAGNWIHYCYTPTVQVNNITYITNIYNNRDEGKGKWYYGPRARDVERHANQRVTKVDLAEADQPGKAGLRDNKLSLYRPEVTSDTKIKPAPANTKTRESIRTTGKTETRVAPAREQEVKRSAGTLVKRYAEPVIKRNQERTTTERRINQSTRKADERRVATPPVKTERRDEITRKQDPGASSGKQPGSRSETAKPPVSRKN